MLSTTRTSPQLEEKVRALEHQQPDARALRQEPLFKRTRAAKANVDGPLQGLEACGFLPRPTHTGWGNGPATISGPNSTNGCLRFHTGEPERRFLSVFGLSTLSFQCSRRVAGLALDYFPPGRTARVERGTPQVKGRVGIGRSPVHLDSSPSSPRPCGGGQGRSGVTSRWRRPSEPGVQQERATHAWVAIHACVEAT